MIPFAADPLSPRTPSIPAFAWAFHLMIGDDGELYRYGRTLTIGTARDRHVYLCGSAIGFTPVRMTPETAVDVAAHIGAGVGAFEWSRFIDQSGRHRDNRDGYMLSVGRTRDARWYLRRSALNGAVLVMNGATAAEVANRIADAARAVADLTAAAGRPFTDREVRLWAHNR